MKIAVIGAVSAGLAALRHITSDIYGNEVICYEKTDQIGGTWVYREETGVDEYDLPIHTSLYQNLRTNLPKEVMGYPDYPIPNESESYISRSNILNFLNSYCDHFNLRQYIRLFHHVEFVKRTDGERKWWVKVKDLQKDSVSTESFDAVMVCNGHYSVPNIPRIKGQDIFQGKQMHSHDYRVLDIFKDKTVVVFGAGPSGLDLALEISKIAKRVLCSHHVKNLEGTFPDNIIQKPDVKELTERAAIFEDGSSEHLNAVFYCTGYKYGFPFLDESCKVRGDTNMVTPLWKHVVAIENPTLTFIGLPIVVCAFNLADIQVRFVLKHWCGKKNFPSKEEMLQETREELETCTNEGLLKRHFHLFNERQGPYYEELAKIAEIKPISPVISNICKDCFMRFGGNLEHYREDNYKIIDDHNFIRYRSLRVLFFQRATRLIIRTSSTFVIV